MSVYKYVIGKDMAPQNKNTSHVVYIIVFPVVLSDFKLFWVIEDGIKNFSQFF